MTGILNMFAAISSSASPSTIYGIQSTQGFPSHNSTSVSSTMALGTAESDREIWVVVSSMTPSTTPTVTIGGNNATKMREESPSGYVSQMTISYWKYVDNGSLGTFAVISVNFNVTAAHSGLIVFTTNPSYVLDFYGDNANDASATTGSINTSSDGWSFYAACTQNGTSGSITEFGGGGSFDMGSNEWLTYGFNSPEDNGTVAINNPSGHNTTANNTITGLSATPIKQPPPLAQFLQTALAVGTASTPHTFSGVDFGAENSNRWIFVTVHDGGGAIPTNVTIGGITATAAVTNGTDFQTCCIYYAKVPTGSSGDIIIDSNSNEKSIGVWRVVTGATNPVADSAFYGEGGTSAMVTIPTGGVAIATNCYDNATGDITPGTLRYSHDGGTDEYVYGCDTVDTGETGATTFNGTENDALSVVAISKE